MAKLERFCEFRQKEVINICDGNRLGMVCDLEFEASGKIVNMIVPEEGKGWSLFGRCREYRIPWKCIKKIGDDIILVEIIDLEAILIAVEK